MNNEGLLDFQLSNVYQNYLACLQEFEKSKELKYGVNAINLCIMMINNFKSYDQSVDTSKFAASIDKSNTFNKLNKLITKANHQLRKLESKVLGI
jgi:hypothetical protein